MAITISGSGITSANIADGTIVNADVADVAASKLTGALPAIDGSALTNLPGGGKVLQVVQDTHYSTSHYSTSSSSFIDSQLSATITSTSTSKLIIKVSLGAQSPSSGYLRYRVLKGSTPLDGEAWLGHNSGETWMSASATWIDTSPSTSATTYKVQVKSNNGNVTWYHHDGMVSTLIITEVGA